MLPISLSINKKVWGSFSDVELNNYALKVFNHYRSQGFPYFPTNKSWREAELKSLKGYDFKKCIDHENKIIRQTMHGLSFCWSYHPHHYEVECSDKRSVYQTFMDDDLLLRVIHKRMKMGDNMSDNGLRKMLKIFSGTQCVSNFRPTAAAAIYSMFCKEGDTVWDMSSGYGGRALGAHLAGVNYIGTDPCTLNHLGVKGMCADLGSNSKLIHSGSEVHDIIPDEVVDFCFTSPPYFDTERYSDEESQSYKKYPSKDMWMNVFMRETIRNCFKCLKSDKYLALNVADVKSYTSLVVDLIQVAEEEGFTHKDTWGLHLSSLAGGGYKTEPILIFQKGEKSDY